MDTTAGRNGKGTVLILTERSTNFILMEGFVENADKLIKQYVLEGTDSATRTIPSQNKV